MNNFFKDHYGQIVFDCEVGNLSVLNLRPTVLWSTRLRCAERYTPTSLELLAFMDETKGLLDFYIARGEQYSSPADSAAKARKVLELIERHLVGLS